MSVSGPQLIVGARLMALGWVPADPGAVGALAPAGVRIVGEPRAFLIQYAVDSAVQTSGLGAHSATVIGIDLVGGPLDATQVPPRMWLAAVASTERACEYFRARGVDCALGRTTLEFRGDAVVALTAVDDVPRVRAVAAVGPPTVAEAGDRVYVRATSRGVVETAHPWIATVTDGWQLTSLEFTGTTGAFELLRPPDEPVAAFGLYSPNAAFSDPGSAGPPAAGR